MRDFSSTTGRKIPILNSLPKEVIPNPTMQYLTLLARGWSHVGRLLAQIAVSNA